MSRTWSQDRAGTIIAVVFFAAMALLGVSGALFLRHPGASAPVALSPTPRHHVLVSPYSDRPFLRGQAQTWSTRGAGQLLPRDISRDYQALGYQWISITDVDTSTTDNQYNAAGVIPVPAIEAAYPFAHFLAYGVTQYPAASSAQQAIDEIHSFAGVAYLARPLAPPSLSYEDIAALRGLDRIEVYDAALARQLPGEADASALWDRLLSSGHRVWGLAGDDLQNNDPQAMGRTSVEVQAVEPSAVLIDDALHRGAFVFDTGETVLAVGTSGGSVTVTTQDAETIAFIGRDGKVLATEHGTRATYNVNWSEGYVRAVASKGSARAWTEPVFVVP